MDLGGRSKRDGGCYLDVERGCEVPVGANTKSSLEHRQEFQILGKSIALKRLHKKPGFIPVLIESNAPIGPFETT